MRRRVDRDSVRSSPSHTTSMNLLFAVAAGSALGGVARYVITGALQSPLSQFPWGTFVVNVVGCLILGATARVVGTAGDLSPVARTFIAAGFCGAFTTFSAFSYETLTMLEKGATARALSYVAASVLLGLLAAMAGAQLARGIR